MPDGARYESAAALADALRAAARDALPRGAFLRMDRGDGLFVTDAPLRAPGSDWEAALARGGFQIRRRGGLAVLRPGPGWMAAFAKAHPHPPDFLCASLQRFDGPPEEESLALFALGLRARGDARAAADFDKRLRQRAAVCLRAGGGGGLYACALLPGPGDGPGSPKGNG